MRAQMLKEVVEGLSATPKRLPCKYFYDAEGSRLFERITELDAYYPTRTELAILSEHGARMAAEIGPHALVLEPGSGAGRKTQLLLQTLDRPAMYVPVDIDGVILRHTEALLAADFPDLAIAPLAADYTRPLPLPELPPGIRVERSLIFYPGSTIGNFEPTGAARFLSNIALRLPAPVQLLIGVDLHKDVAVIEAAYNDPDGVTAAFNRNVLRHINRVLGSEFDPDAFAHVAFYDPERQRIEMHLESRRDQEVRLDGCAVRFRRGERIHTESSYKYTLEGFEALARHAGYVHRRTWVDERKLFSVQLYDLAQAAQGLASDRA
jgi:L-histidine Nalpha-methyltransferase